MRKIPATLFTPGPVKRSGRLARPGPTERKTAAAIVRDALNTRDADTLARELAVSLPVLSDAEIRVLAAHFAELATT